MKCEVEYCLNNTRFRPPGISFHKIPGDEPRRSQWIRYIGLDESNILKNSVICSEHFLEKDIIRLSASTCLGENAVPVLKLTDESPVRPITKPVPCEKLSSQEPESVNQIAARQMLNSSCKPIFSGIFLCDTTRKVEPTQKFWTTEAPVHTAMPTEIVFVPPPTIRFPQNNPFTCNDRIIEVQPISTSVQNNSLINITDTGDGKKIVEIKKECSPEKPQLEPVTIIRPDPAQTLTIYKLETKLNTVQNKLKVKNVMLKKARQRVKRLEERLSRSQILIDFQKEKLQEHQSSSKEIDRLQKDNFKLRKILNLIPKVSEEQNCPAKNSNSVKTTTSKMVS